MSEFKKVLHSFKGADVYLLKYTSSEYQKFIHVHKTEMGFIKNSLVHQSPNLYDFEPKNKHNFIIFMIKSKVLIGIITGFITKKNENWIHFLWCNPDYRRNGYGSELASIIEKQIQNEHISPFNINVVVTPNSCKFYDKINYIFKSMLPVNEYNIVNSIYFKEIS
jgi:ribosomal protein S18 acetylase RimI-like enzyme